MTGLENIYDNLRDVINNLPDNFNILEETIDIDLQKEYFETSQSLKFDPEKDLVPEMIEKINNAETTVEECKELLQKLALIDSVEAYRAIESFILNPLHALKEWAIIALQQSKMVIHCSLLDEQQVFISTGLGGKNGKLRYFMIFPFNDHILELSLLQKKALDDELHFFLSKNEGEIENISFSKTYATSTILLPLKAPIPDIVRNLLDECNQYDNFLHHNILITNMKYFSHDEITDIIAQFDEVEEEK
jgi:hypothetical protein